MRFWSPKLRFLAILHPITLHDCNNIYYVVLALILMHNMMVEACLEFDKRESAEFYNTLVGTETESENVGAVSGGDDNDVEMEPLEVCFSLLHPTHVSAICIRLLSLLISCTSFFHL